MKIVILQGAFLPVPTKLGGAVEKMWFALGKRFAQTGHEVLQISRSFENFPKEEWIDGVQHKRVKGYDTPSSGILLKWLDLKYTFSAIRLIPKDADVIVTNTFFSPILIGAKQKCYVDVQRMPKGQMKFYKKAGRIRANSTPVADAIKAELDSAYHPKVVMIPNPIPFIPDANTVMQKQKTILYVGRIHPEKGLEILLKAYQLAQLQNAGWQLTIVGPWQIQAGGGGDAYIEQLKTLAGANPSITFTGPVYDINQLNRYYQSASIFVYPSVAEKGETFGIAPLEAMAWGCVPVVSALECFQDFIQHGKNGLIFNHRQATPEKDLAADLVQLTQQPQQIQQLSGDCLKVRKTHSINTIADLFLADFKAMVNNV